VSNGFTWSFSKAVYFITRSSIHRNYLNRSRVVLNKGFFVKERGKSRYSLTWSCVCGAWLMSRGTRRPEVESEENVTWLTVTGTMSSLVQYSSNDDLLLLCSVLWHCSWRIKCIYCRGASHYGRVRSRGRPKWPNALRNKANFACIWNRQLLLSLIYVNLEKKKSYPKWFHVRCETQWKTSELCGCQCSFGETSSSISRRSHQPTICRVSFWKDLPLLERNVDFV
jgi:hypothetical protein